MAIPKMEEDVEIISKLGDSPGSDNGLNAQQLKAKFDLGAKRIKAYINDVLLPHMNMLVDVQALLNGILDSSLSKEDKAANAKAVGERLSTIQTTANAALPKSGGIMTGGINMNNKQLTGLPAPKNDADGVNKGYVDTDTVTATLAADSWTGDAAPYTQTITVDGLTDKKIAHCHPVHKENLEEDLEIMDACACVSYARRNGAEVTFWCLVDKPGRDIEIEVEVGV